MYIYKKGYNIMKYEWIKNIDKKDIIEYELIPINQEKLHTITLLQKENNFILRANIVKIKNKKLNAKNLDEAKIESHEILKNLLNKKITELNKMIAIFNNPNFLNWKDEIIKNQKFENIDDIITLKSTLYYNNKILPYIINLYEENYQSYYYEFAFGGIKLRKINKNTIEESKKFVINFCSERLLFLHQTTVDFYEIFL